MKTTVEISDALLEAARQVATRERTTVRSLIEEGLRQVVGSRKSRTTYRLRDASVPGKGLSPDLDGKGWDAIRDRIYDGGEA